MSEPDDLDLPEDARAELDALPPAQRREWITYLRDRQKVWAQLQARTRCAVDILNQANDTLLSQLSLQPDEASRQALLDQATATAFMGEALLSAVRGDAEAYALHREAWDRYAATTANYRIAARDEPDPMA
ncbi:hypothetical protein [Kutzneria kofuensis]|uniref:Uncharacterized protein n=1 Tax=Kutzneria kofuensis TaxID=103725 RepID=A0A7W9NFK1_9PSEU|nr:hypothetical protein [Kutzneria kofuensis]MBB5890604.1 hypothetical protein [Kutzneria kofuensis]